MYYDNFCHVTAKEEGEFKICAKYVTLPEETYVGKEKLSYKIVKELDVFRNDIDNTHKLVDEQTYHISAVVEKMQDPVTKASGKSTDTQNAVNMVHKQWASMSRRLKVDEFFS